MITDECGNIIVCDLQLEKNGHDQVINTVELAVVALADCIIKIYVGKVMGE